MKGIGGSTPFFKETEVKSMKNRIRRYLIDILVYYMPLITIGSGAVLLYRVVTAGAIK